MNAEKLLAVDLGEHDVDVGKAAVGRPHLFAVQEPRSVSLPNGARPRAQRIRAGPGFAQTVRADDFRRHDARQIALLLLRRAEAQDRNDREAGLRAERRRKRGAGAHFLADDDGGPPCRDRRRRPAREHSVPTRPSSPARRIKSRALAQFFRSSSSSAGNTSLVTNSRAV